MVKVTYSHLGNLHLILAENLLEASGKLSNQNCSDAPEIVLVESCLCILIEAKYNENEWIQNISRLFMCHY